MDGELHLHPAIDQLLRQFPDLVLRLRHRHAVAGHDHHALGEGHHRGDVAGLDRLLRTGDLLRLPATAEIGEQHVADRPVHRLGHQPGQQDARRADHHAGDDQRLVAQHVTLERDGQAGEGVVQRDHHRHVGAADRQGHQHAQRQRHHEERDDVRDRQGIGRPATERQHRDEHQQVERLLAGEHHPLVQPSVELGPGDDRTGQRHRADRRTDHRQREGRRIRLTRGQRGDRRLAPVRGVAMDQEGEAQQFNRADRRRRTAAHAVVERDHLRHVGNRHLLAGYPGHRAADRHRRDDQRDVVQVRQEERRHRGDQHAQPGPADAAARGQRRGHALQAEQEQGRGDQVAGLDQEGQQFGQGPAHHLPSLPGCGLLDLNISSMRSVTT